MANKRLRDKILEEMLYEAIYQPEGSDLLPYEVIKNPELSVYIDDFGKKDDCCFIAEIDDNIIGAVWARILASGVKGYGNIDENTPEFARYILNEYRGIGIGTELQSLCQE
ncbi:GNAT family N-acetyltransferase [Metaclostridioides mangenotii]|uniref:GNAT family N-acetyltransferase n=1 Tax=Metaclostridioides mangenotii TaxID=1540 RepID=UPI000A7BEC2D|nr:GNAT family N-acetyltransferase [Clostridioides mangenotii]